MSKRGLATSAGVVLAGMALGQLGRIGVFAILSRALAKGVYGQFQQAWLVGSAVCIILAMGLPQSMQYFIPRIRAPALRRRAFVQSLLLIQASGILAAVLLYVLARPVSLLVSGNEALAGVLRSYWPVALFLAFWMRVDCVFNSVGRAGAAGVSHGVYGALLVATLGGAAIFTGRLGHLFMAQGLAMLVAMLAAAAVGWRGLGRQSAPDDPPAPQPPPTGERPLAVRRQLAYALPLMGTFLVATITRLVDKLLVSNRYPAAEFAVYANGAIQIPIGTILIAAAYSVLLPRLAREFGDGNVERVIELNRSAIRSIAAIVFPSAVFLAVFSTNLVVVVFGRRYADSGWILMVYSLGMLALLYSPFTVVNATGRTGVNLWLSLAAMAINVAFSWTGLVLLGMIGAAIGSAAYMLVSQLLFAWVVGRLVGSGVGRLIPWGHLGRTMLACAAAAVAAAGALLLPLPPLGRTAVGAGLFAAAYALVAVKAGLLGRGHLGMLRGLLRRQAGE
jgi:O-antigen/teichoic acid export membrane protein